ncbi:LLM class flavin-dependent oxidoreductase [Paenibacillus aestuarii]|uniref:LLM class flavin-dependent oxidoreductase n=1 Tax=Paenibacillus aestuarii TaxID=516965 RepID=A0ABW0K470_9BACL|nr:LLM class flavin-dependent oxidoreductase [Paenibacillus aestuarii]
MKLSVLDLAPVLPQADAAVALKQALLLAQTAERLGFERYWVAEHHDMPGLACTAPEVLLAHIGAQTQRIRLGSGAVLLPHYKPMKVAEAFHMLATLYPGRIDLGLGRAPGGSAHAAIALSGNFLASVGRMPETLQELLAFLNGTYTYEGQPVAARPVPAEPPQVWMLGTNKKSAEFAAQYGTGYVFGHFMSDTDAQETIAAYRSQFQPSAQGGQARAMLAVGVICADTAEAAQALAAESAAWFRPTELRDPQLPAAQPSKAADTGRKLLVGTPQQVQAQLKELGAACGVEEFLVVTYIADYALRLRSYELLAERPYREHG